VALTSTLGQAATDDADGETTDGDADGEGVGLAEVDGLGVTGFPHAVTSATANTTTALLRGTWGRRVRGIVDRIIRLRPSVVGRSYRSAPDPAVRAGLRPRIVSASDSAIRRTSSWVATRRLAFGLVPVIGSPRTALRRRLPGVLRISELALRQVVKPLLLVPEDLELVFALLRFNFGRVDCRRGAHADWHAQQPT
jgi:hypothetical protein